MDHDVAGPGALDARVVELDAVHLHDVAVADVDRLRQKREAYAVRRDDKP